MLLLNILVLSSVAIATATAQVIDCSDFIDRKLTVKIDDEIFEYSDVELYYIYDEDRLDVNEYNSGKTANLDLKENKISFRGMVVSNSVINENFSFKSEKPLSTNTLGFAKINYGSSATFSHCKFSVTKQSNAKSHWPRNLEKKILLEVSKCLDNELCPALGNVHYRSFQENDILYH